MEAVGMFRHTPLHVASAKGHVAVAKLLLERGACLEAADNSGRRALNVAASEGHLEVVQLLLGQGAAVDATDEDGYTALNAASCRGFVKVAQVLVDHGARSDTANCKGDSALVGAVKNGHAGVAKVLVERDVSTGRASAHQWGDHQKALHVAARTGHLEMVRALWDAAPRFCESTGADDAGFTALHFAANARHFQVVKLLLERRAKITPVKGKPRADAALLGRLCLCKLRNLRGGGGLQ